MVYGDDRLCGHTYICIKEACLAEWGMEYAMQYRKNGFYSANQVYR